MFDLLARSLRLRLLVLLAAIAAPIAIAGCNTVEGMGEDLQESSENVEEEIED